MAKKKSEKPSKGKPSKPKSSGLSKAGAVRAYAKAFDAKAKLKDRQAALAFDPTVLCQSTKTFQGVLKILRDPAEPIDVRLSAFQALAAAQFSSPDFDSCRAEYVAALREVSEDANDELRQRALGMLVRQKDKFAQKKLLAGLKNPDKALVPTEKALHLLTYDPHVDAYSSARDVVASPPNSLAKQEALRLLASDPESASLLETVLQDKNEAVESRQICAAALHLIDPSKYQTKARELVMDKDENPDIQAMSLTGLTYFGDKSALSKDAPLQKRVDELGRDATTPIKALAQNFLSKYPAD